MAKKLVLPFAILFMFLFVGQVFADPVMPMPVMSSSAVFTIDSNTLTVDGKLCEMDVAPFVQNGRTYVPIRYLGQVLGASDVKWLNGEVDFQFPAGKKVSLMLNQPWLNDSGKYKLMDVVPVLKDPPGRVFLPARFVAEALDCKVIWDSAKQTMTITR